MKPSHRIFMFLLFFLFILTILSVSFLSILLGFVNNNKIAYGVHFEDTPLYGMSQTEVSAFLEKAAKKKLSQNALLFSYQDKTWQITPQEIHLTADIPATVQETYAIGRSGNPFRNLIEELSCAVYGRRIEFSVSYDHQALAQKLDTLAESIDTPPVSARIVLDANGNLLHQPASVGKKVDTQELANNVKDSLLHLDLPKREEIAVHEQAPALLDADLAPIDTILSSYTTQFNGGNENRSQNIRIAANALDSILLKSGHEFSFNQAVGNRIAASGYKNAAVIVEGKVEQDIGGGVCQVSSTLYNAILLAGLESTARTSHFYPSTYVPAGLDATVADGQIDFKFRNNHPHGIYLLARVYDNNLTIFILGNHADLNGTSVSLFTRTDKPGPGPTISAYRIYKKNGQEVSREFLHTDHYDIEYHAAN